MPCFVIGHCSIFNPTMNLELIEAETWRAAVAKHSDFRRSGWIPAGETLDEVKDACLEADSILGVLELPQGVTTP